MYDHMIHILVIYASSLGKHKYTYITPAVADKSEGVQLLILLHFRPSCPSANYRYGHLESNALIGIEFGEFRQKLKNFEFRQNSIFRESMGAIWIDSVSFEVVPAFSIFFIFFNS